MRIEELHNVLGLTNVDALLQQAIEAAGGSVQVLSPKKIRELGSDFVNINDKGVSLSFLSRGDYEDEHGVPRGAGPYVLACIFYFPFGEGDAQAYEGVAPFADASLKSRDDALRAYGAPHKTEEDEGEIEWDEWIKGGRQLRVSYTSELAIQDISVAVPRA
ncbi:hypothetical protein ACNI65_09400 [Roseateles sp. So40a]|uniref:hypothetical protein n=1 Tax=Roseateles sp. So40a TaxID=3400226 RepID=UPI003A8C5CAB